MAAGHEAVAGPGPIVRLARRVGRRGRAIADRHVPWARPLADAVAFRIANARGPSARDVCLRAADWAPWNPAEGPPAIPADERAAVVALADRALRHEFDLLGSGLVCLGEDIDWSRDFKSGHRWDPLRRHPPGSWQALPPGVDVKVPWELSRCQHLVTLAIADLLTGDAKYAAEIERQMRHWIARNPAGRGVNWMCSMDVGIRAVNWITALQVLRRRTESAADPGFLAAVVEALWMAGLHIRRHLEWGGPSADTAGNHFVANLVGLIGIGGFFRHTARGREWLDFGRTWLAHEIERQVHADGTHFETSTAYHRLVMEMFVWGDAVCRRLGMPLPAACGERLARMADFVAAYVSPAGDAAQFGDNDSGRLLTAGISRAADHRYLAAGRAGFGAGLDRRLLGIEAGGTAAEWSPEIAVFPDGGYAFARVPGAWIGFRAGPVTRHGSHAHGDQLSFVLHVHGENVIVDSGTGSYSADLDLRNRLRSTTAHATPLVNGWEQNRFDPGRHGLFRMADDTRARLVRVERSADGVELIGEHEGFSRERRGLTVRRRLHLSSSALVIEDSFVGLRDGDSIGWRFPLRPGLAPRMVAARGWEIPLAGTVVRLTPPDEGSIAIADSVHSPAYGVVEPAVSITSSATVDATDGQIVYATWRWDWSRVESADSV